ncbi:MAG: ATP-binding protein, partial [Bacillota bacterium]
YGIVALYLALALMLYFNFLLQREVKRRIATEKQLIEKIAHKDKMEAIGNLAAGIAHEIRNPLTSIKTFVELLPQKYDNPLFREKISYFVPREIERLNSLLNTLLDYARPRKSLQQTENLLDLVRNTLVLFGTMFEENKIRIAVEIDPDLKVFVDRQQIQQVFINVIMNAVEATEGVSEPKILIAAEQKAKEVIIVFQDNGMGIENDNLRKIFDPFFTTKPTGTGLGLAVSYQILKENMGRIWVESKPGEGTKVFISLPIGKEV